MLGGMDEAPLCHWMTCDKAAVDDGYLCENHLAKVLSGKVSTSPGAKDLLIGFALGVAGNAAYDAAKGVWEGPHGPTLGTWNPAQQSILKTLVGMTPKERAQTFALVWQTVGSDGLIERPTYAMIASIFDKAASQA